MKKSNDIRHKIHTKDAEGNPLHISIRLNDECKNGHQDFAMTGSLYTKGRPLNDNNCQTSGCIHDVIIAARPDLKIFANLHLSDYKGAPMYALENGFYHLKNSPAATAMEYLRINEAEYNTLLASEDKLYFAYLLEAMGLPARWKEQADKAIQILQEMTETEFVIDSSRAQYTPLTEDQRTTIKNRIDSGYYQPEKITERTETAQAAARQKVYDKLLADKDKSIKKIEDEYNVKIAVLNAGMSLENFIYYTHSNTGTFNWMDHYKKVTNEELSDFLAKVDLTNLPAGILFNLKG